ncbi:hypothetical protein NC653_010921 [Populus alba x Populus x berolinensis]|uniref:Uncharacterized protein n=1 Tax=Populus alba x Populus x berolinensis TaxID=444605 RepID=A0AAD6R0Y7_9ROSI|nr:hypothetical protein NC653_010921 [Populus alba x Populus x berolinensis]
MVTPLNHNLMEHPGPELSRHYNTRQLNAHCQRECKMN